jgi:colicin import membrane protein
MKKPITRSVGRLESIRTADQKLSLPVLLSFMGHLIFCILFIVLPKINLDSNKPASIINVQLVSLDVSMPVSTLAPEPQAPAPEAAPVAQPEASKPAAAVSTAPKSEETVSLAKKEPEKKQSMKKRTFKKERLMQSALKDVEKRVEESKTDPKQQALDRIRAELQGKAAQPPPDNTGAAVASTGMSGEGKRTSDIQRIYYAEVAFSIQRNWAFSEQLASGEKNLYNEVGFKIMRSGEIRDIWFDRRSGNSHLDESARKAILKSSPLPPIPDEIKGTYIELGARFTPEGIN